MMIGEDVTSKNKNRPDGDCYRKKPKDSLKSSDYYGRIIQNHKEFECVANKAGRHAG